MKIHEILQKITNAKSRDDRIKLLKDNNSLGLRDILKGSFDDTIQWDLPEGDVPLEEDEIPEKSKWNLVDVTTKLAICVKNKRNAKVPDLKKESTFLELVKNVDREDSKVLIAMKDKKLTKMFRNVTKSLVKDTFPNLIVK